MGLKHCIYIASVASNGKQFSCLYTITVMYIVCFTITVFMFIALLKFVNIGCDSFLKQCRFVSVVVYKY